MKNRQTIFLATLMGLSILYAPKVHATDFNETIRGRILLDVEQHGEAWYVEPATLKRHYLGQKDDAYQIMRSLGLGVGNADLNSIPLAISWVDDGDTDGDGVPDRVESALGTNSSLTDSDGDGHSDLTELTNGYNPLGAGGTKTNAALAKQLSGKIVLQVEQHGEAWYINPVDHKRYYLGRAEDAYQIMRKLSLGISSSNLTRVQKAPNSLLPPKSNQPEAPKTPTSPAPASSPLPDSENYHFETISVNANGSTFSTRVLRLKKSAFSVLTSVTANEDCQSNCPAKPLADHVSEYGAFAGVNGTYFCPPDYAACADHLNTFDPPVFDSGLGKMINESKVQFHNRPMVVITESGALHYLHRTQEHGDTIAELESTLGEHVTAAFGTWPALVENNDVIVNSEPLEAPFFNKGRRGSFGWTDDEYIIAIAENATMVDSAYVLKALGAKYAVNIDGGGSSALYIDGKYKVGPGRLLPNAILFKSR